MSCFLLIGIELSNAAFLPNPLLFFSDDVQLHPILILIGVGLHRPLAVDVGDGRVLPYALLFLNIVPLGLVFLIGVVVLQRDLLLKVEVHLLAGLFVVLPDKRTSIVVVVLLLSVVYRRLAHVDRGLKQHPERSFIQ